MAKTQGKPTGMNFQGSTGMAPVEGDVDPFSNLGGPQDFQGMTQTRTGYQTAVHVQVPRDIKKVERDILAEAAEMGEDFLYAWDVKDKTSKTGKSRIEGISIDGALIMMRNWGNCHCPTDLEKETPSHFLLKSTFIDLEKGFSIPRLYRQRKGQRAGGMDADRAEDIAFQIGQSKCQRNAIEKGVPAWIQTRALEAAKLAAEKRYENVPKAIEDVKRYAARVGITDAELERKVGASFADWLPRDLVYLRSVFKSIADRQSTISLEFREEPPPGDAVDGASVTEPAKSEPKGVDFPDLHPTPTPAAEPAATTPAANAQAPAETPAAEPSDAAEPEPEPESEKQPDPVFAPPTPKKK